MPVGEKFVIFLLINYVDNSGILYRLRYSVCMTHAKYSLRGLCGDTCIVSQHVVLQCYLFAGYCVVGGGNAV